MKLYFVLSFTWKDKHFALVEEQSDNYNLLPLFSGYIANNNIGELVIIHYCKTKKYAYELCEQWNESYKRNGRYLSVNDWKCNEVI